MLRRFMCRRGLPHLTGLSSFAVAATAASTATTAAAALPHALTALRRCATTASGNAPPPPAAAAAAADSESAAARLLRAELAALDEGEMQSDRGLSGHEVPLRQMLEYAIDRDPPPALCERLYRRYVLPARPWRVVARAAADLSPADAAGGPPLHQHPDFAHFLQGENPLDRETVLRLIKDGQDQRDADLSGEDCWPLSPSLEKMVPAFVAMLEHRDERIVLHGVEMIFRLTGGGGSNAYHNMIERDFAYSQRGRANLRCTELLRSGDKSTRREACKHVCGMLSREYWSALHGRKNIAKVYAQLHQVLGDANIDVVVASLLTQEDLDVETRGYAARILVNLVPQVNDDVNFHGLAQTILDCIILPCDDVGAQVNCIMALDAIAKEISSECEQPFLLHLPIARAFLESNSAPEVILAALRLLQDHGEIPSLPLALLHWGLLPVALSHLEAVNDGCARTEQQTVEIVCAAAALLARLAESREQRVRAQLFAQEVPAKLTAALLRHRGTNKVVSAISPAVGNLLRFSSSSDDARPIFDSGLVSAIASALPSSTAELPDELLDERNVVAAATAAALSQAWRVCTPAQVDALAAEHDLVARLTGLLRRHRYYAGNWLPALDGLLDGNSERLEQFKALRGDAAVRDAVKSWSCGGRAARAFAAKFGLF